LSWENGKGRSPSRVIYDREESARLRSEWRLATPAKYRHVLRAQQPRTIWLKSAEDSIRKPKSGAGEPVKLQPVEGEAATLSEGITLRQAWERYRDAHLVRKGRSELTIESYRDHVERIFIEWLDAPLQELGLDPAKVVTKHDDITKENGPYIANGSMRTLRAICNHARKANKSLPADNPVNAIDWNGEKRRDTGMGTSDFRCTHRRPEIARLPSCSRPSR
jgi:hypothetical protein